MNQEEANRCIEISKQKHNAGNLEAAIKFARKAISLHASDSSRKWLEKLENSVAQPTSSKDTQNKSGSQPSSATRKRASNPEEESKQQRPFTSEQTAGIQRIKEAKKKGDLYAIIGLEKSCDEADVKKAYRKLALKYHPDKCSAPGTDEAFKAIAHAFTVLSDADKRAQYDRFGIDSGSSASSNAQGNPFAGHAQNFQGFDDIRAEDLFNMFFNSEFGGGGLRGGPGIHFQFGGPGRGQQQAQQQQRARRQQQYQEDREAGGLRGLLQYLPILFIFGFSLLSSIASLFTESTPSYSFQRTSKYSSSRLSEYRSINYFVNHREFKPVENDLSRLRRVEREIEQSYLQLLQTKCRQDQADRAERVRKASGFWPFSGDTEKARAERAVPLKSCEELARFGIYH